MKKNLLLFIVIIMSLLLCACNNKNLIEESESPVTAQEAASSTDLEGTAGVTESDVVEETTSPELIDSSDVDWRTIYTDFLSENYDSLSDLCFGGIAGVGFIDLDLDGAAELLLFDSGASASMGVQLFDIVDGSVYCVSANVEGIGSAYGGSYLSDVYVNANYLEDFHLYKNSSTGEKFYIVESSNGAEDFSYTELIRFKTSNGALRPESLLYKYESYSYDENSETTTTSVIYEYDGASISKEDYTSKYNAVFADCTEQNSTSGGVFIWEAKNYGATHDEFMTLVQSAMDKYSD